MKKERIDILLVQKGLISGRDRAKRLIMAGEVWADGKKVEKPSEVFAEDISLEIKGSECPYVSRGGKKLEKAISHFGISLEDKICMDVGASTGGFTDCMLQNGAQMVYSVDVGYGQLDWKLRNDDRVVVLERTNARYLNRETIPREIQFASIDVSFISLKLILPAVKSIMAAEGQIVALIKPQFEAGRDKVGKKGVVRDPSVHQQVIQNVLAYGKEAELVCQGLTFSPIKGPCGNIEYLCWFGGQSRQEAALDIEQVVKAAHTKLDEAEAQPI